MTATPRTRRRLREALENAEDNVRALREAIRSAGLSVSASYPYGLIPRTHYSIGGAIHQESLDEAVKTAEAATRRETLEKVLQALEIKDYINGWAGLLNSRAPLAAEHDTDRFWSDLNTALEVRAAEKHVEAQRKTAEKVAGLTKKAPEFALRFAYAEPAVSTEDIETIRKVGETLPKKKPAAKKAGDKK